MSWEELDTVSAQNKHDYKSDDIETVMRVYDMVKEIDNDKCFMSELVKDLGKNLESCSDKK